MEICTAHKFTGIDVSKQFFDAYFFDSKGQLIQRRIKQDQQGYSTFTGFIGKDSICVMEAIGTYYLPLAQWLYDHGIKVVVENPLKIKRFSQMHLRRHKTDEADAKIIYDYGVTVLSNKIVFWCPQSSRIQEMQQCDNLSQRLNKELTAITNTHEALSQLSFVNTKVKRMANDTIEQF